MLEEHSVRSALVKKIKEIITDNTFIKSVALSFCTFYDEISTVIPGAISTKQLMDNIKSISNYLDPSIVSKLESAKYSILNVIIYLSYIGNYFFPFIFLKIIIIIHKID